jgi:hypothetical protein
MFEVGLNSIITLSLKKFGGEDTKDLLMNTTST